MTAVASPFGLRTQAAYRMVEDEDIDAEGEDVEEIEQKVEAAATPRMPDGNDENENGDAESSEASVDTSSEEDDAMEDRSSGTRPTRTRRGAKSAISDEEDVESASDTEQSSSAEDDESEKDSSEAESAEGEDWEDKSEAAENASVEVATRDNCVYCGGSEEHDPGDEFEEYMACSVCGDNAHRQCARMNNSLEPNEECVENALQPTPPNEATPRRRSSATKFTRDLLPAARGGSRPGSHSVFNHLILDDDPLDGSRSLRKRKSSSEQREEPKKRPRKDSVRSQSVLASELKAAGIIRVGDDDEIAEADEEEDIEAESTSTRKSRPARSSKKRKSDEFVQGSAMVIEQSVGSIIVSFRVEPAKLRALPKAKPKKKRPRPRESTVEVQRERDQPMVSHSTHYATPFYAFHERENDELKSKPYGGVLSEVEADTSKTLPLQADRVKFSEARQKAEEEWKLKVANAEVEGEIKARTQKLAGPPSKIKCVNFGGYEIETWYAAPYPEEYSRNRVLYICEFCLKYMNSDFVAWRHKLKCPAKHPPGDEIYRDGSVSVFEVDGRKNPVYCQNLCLLAKLFLGSKTLYYDVEPFLFYVMTEYDEFGCHFVGYFSKEKRPSSQNNVSCILTLPTHQRKGYGNLLISFSYLLTRVEKKTGSPEKPLSDMGLVSYRNYWRLILSYELLSQREALSIIDLSDRTGMTADDIVAALEGLRALVRDPVTRTYALRLDYDYFQQCIDEWEAKGYVTINEDALVWTPYIMGRSNLAHYETAPPLPTVAPREDEEEDKDIAPEEGVQQTAKANAIAAEESAMANGDDSQPKTNGNTSDSSKQSQSQNKDFDSIDPAMSQLEGSTPMPIIRQISFTTPIRVPSSPPRMNGISSTSAPESTPFIPSVRYEVFPPIPGTAARRRGGWRGGPRKSAMNGASTPKATPNMRRSGTGLGIGKGKPPASAQSKNGETAPSTRRTRLAGQLDGDAGTPKDPDSDEDAEGEKDEDEPLLANDNEALDDEKNAEGDEVLDDAEGDDDDEATADGDFEGDQDDEESEEGSAVESEEDN
ncbi:histone acetyltransferase SAS3, partial [Lecanoromycetidae sp. Uapishka_2]